LRAEREAARRALEGKVARASKRLARQDGMGRGTSSTRVYRPDAIPDQSGTTRRGNEAVFRPLGVRSFTSSISSIEDIAGPGPLSEVTSAPSSGEAARPTPPPPPITLSVEERYQLITERLGRADASFQREYRESFDMSWIYHDSALEGVVYTFQELKTAVDPSAAVVPDSSLQPACEEIRRHRLAIELVRDLAERKRVPINVDMVKKLYVTLHPEEGDVKTVKYRKDIPQHRLYFHEYVPPDKIAYRVRQIVDWLNGPEPKKMKNPLRVAARVHYDLVRVFPFQTDSGKVSRLLMNLILMRSGYPPAIIHSTERQRYYEALKGQLPIIITMVADAISNALLSIEKLLDDYESKPRSGTTIAGSTSVS
jgi:Fic family protein